MLYPESSETPKAFTSFSPGLLRSGYPGLDTENNNRTLKALANYYGLANAFSVRTLFVC